MGVKKRWVSVALGFLVSMAVMLPTHLDAAAKPFVFGLLLVGPHNDQGLSQAHYEGGKYVVANVPGTKMIFIDRANPTDRPDVTITQLVDDMVEKGAKLIIANSVDMQNGIREAALKHPKIRFVQVSGDDVLTGKAPKNLSNLMGRMEYGKMMAGFAAALTTKTGQIGYIGPFDDEQSRRLASSCYLGARYAWTHVLKKDPKDLKFKVTWIGFWFYISGTKKDPAQVTNDYFNSDYDVVISGIVATEIPVLAKQMREKDKTVWAIPYDNAEACEGLSDVCLGVPFFNWGPGYLGFIKAAKSGKWNPKWIWLKPDWKEISNPSKTAVGFVAGPALSESAAAHLDKFIRELSTGNVNLFKGPLNYQDGKPFIKAGQTAGDKQIWYMEQLLEGIEEVSTAK
ncbi:MAG: BMP family ABC transporter substrate-binding protein [Desulfobacterales bacterium]|jgi:simple sugar transport system substrate-binding protein